MEIEFAGNRFFWGVSTREHESEAQTPRNPIGRREPMETELAGNKIF